MDYDNNGLLDLYVSNLEDNNLLFRNNGDGSFSEVGKAAGLDLVGPIHFVWADFNNDGLPDVFFTKTQIVCS